MFITIPKQNLKASLMLSTRALFSDKARSLANQSVLYQRKQWKLNIICFVFFFSGFLKENTATVNGIP